MRRIGYFSFYGTNREFCSLGRVGVGRIEIALAFVPMSDIEGGVIKRVFVELTDIERDGRVFRDNEGFRRGLGGISSD